MEYCISQWVNGTDSQINYNHSVSKQKEKGKKKRLHKSKHFYLLARKNRCFPVSFTETVQLLMSEISHHSPTEAGNAV